MLPEEYTSWLLTAFNKSGRKDLKLSACVKDFYNTYKDVLDLKKMHPYQVGDWFTSFLNEYPKSVAIDTEKENCDIKIIDDASKVATHVETATTQDDAMTQKIKKMKLQGISNREIGKNFGVSEATIRRKLKG